METNALLLKIFEYISDQRKIYTASYQLIVSVYANFAL